jgi:tetratricopeptide (TPR) repeat protein
MAPDEVFCSICKVASSANSQFMIESTCEQANGDVRQLIELSEEVVVVADMYDRALALMNKGRELSQQRRYSEALEAYARALKELDSKLYPDVTAGIWIAIGNTHIDQRRYDEALAAFDLALKYCVPNGVEAHAAWFNKATVLHTLGRVTEATEAERRANAIGS